MAQKLYITNSFDFALVDTEDYFRCLYHSWSVDSKRGAVRSSVGPLSNFVMNNSLVMYDHKNRDPFDNRKQNLRQATQQQNRMNTSKSDFKSSEYKGVSFCQRDKCWRGYIKTYGKSKALGTFPNEKLAAKAYDKAAKELFKEFANLNFPEDSI